MMKRRRLEADLNRDAKWFNSPVKLHRGMLNDIRRHIPSFERRGFGLTQADSQSTRLNQRLDTIVRMPFDGDTTFVPVGVVSKGYTLVQHEAIIETAADALRMADIDLGKVIAEVRITEYVERMGLSLYLPEQFDFDPGDGEPMALRVECLNSVDGSTRFRALMGWFRFVCSNGLVIGVTQMDVRRRHVGEIHVKEIGDVLKAGFTDAEADKANFTTWMKRALTPKEVEPWVDKALLEKWGFKAAARAYHIARTGCDGWISGQYKGQKPTTIAMETADRVPGANTTCSNLFDLSQILAWLAKERRDVQEQLEWREQIPGLMKPFLS